MRREVAAYNRLSCPPLQPGEEWWTGTRYELSRRLRSAQRHGEVVVLARGTLTPGIDGALVRRVRQAPVLSRHGVRIALWVAGATLPLVFVGWMVCSLAGAVVAAPWQSAAVAVLTLTGACLCARGRRSTGHRCSGLHCSGCRG